MPRKLGQQIEKKAGKQEIYFNLSKLRLRESNGKTCRGRETQSTTTVHCELTQNAGIQCLEPGGLNLRPSKAAPNYLFIDLVDGLFIVCFQLATLHGVPALVAMVRCTNFLGHNTKQDQTVATDTSFALFMPWEIAGKCTFPAVMLKSWTRTISKNVLIYIYIYIDYLSLLTS